MQEGRIIPQTPGQPVEVAYDLWVAGPHDAGGRIRIRDNANPAEAFMRVDDAACVLETASGARVRIVFANANGAFTCEAAEALAAGA